MKPKAEAYDLLVMGMGCAGLAAALFAARRGCSVAICGATGGLDHSSGLIDLLAVHPVEQGRTWADPWQAIPALVKDRPGHPYSLLREGEIRAALGEFVSFMAEHGLAYRGNVNANSPVLTPAGTIKYSYLMPQSLWTGSVALRERAPALLIGFHGLKGFSPRQIAEVRRGDWPGLNHTKINFPGKTGELYPEHMALALGEPSVVRRLAESLPENALKGVDYLGFPAVLGLENPGRVVAALEELTGKKVFEIPTLPPSLAGRRLRSACGRGLSALGVASLNRQLVFRAEPLAAGGWRLHLGRESATHTVLARNVILASGRFLGHGLLAERGGVTEPVFHLPVAQPPERKAWVNRGFFAPAGHPLSRAGILTDSDLRPLDGSGKPVPGLRAAGVILANHDWAREKCGAGLAIATAYKAVQSLPLPAKGGEA